MQSEDWDKIAEDYFSHIESPFSPGVKNPLLTHLKQIKGENLSAIDLGCGIGNLIPFIKGIFPKVVCVDFSAEMLAKAQEKFGSQKHVEFLQGDLNNLSKFQDQFTHAFAINSIVTPSIEAIKKQLSEVYGVLKKGGTAYFIFPALESDILYAAIAYDRTVKGPYTEESAMNHTEKKIDINSYNFLFGLYEEEGKQKHYFKIELEYRLEKAGFTNLQFDRVLYPWEKCTDASLRKCGERLHLFDWFVRAEKF